MNSAPMTQGDHLMAAKARKQTAQRAAVRWDDESLAALEKDSIAAARQRIDEPKTGRWIQPTGHQRRQLAEGVTLQPQLLTSLRQLFDAIDSDGNGVLSKEEATRFWGSNFGSVNASSMFSQVDTDQDASITWIEFLIFWKAVVAYGYAILRHRIPEWPRLHHSF